MATAPMQTCTLQPKFPAPTMLRCNAPYIPIRTRSALMPGQDDISLSDCAQLCSDLHVCQTFTYNGGSSDSGFCQPYRRSGQKMGLKHNNDDNTNFWNIGCFTSQCINTEDFLIRLDPTSGVPFEQGPYYLYQPSGTGQPKAKATDAPHADYFRLDDSGYIARTADGTMASRQDDGGYNFGNYNPSYNFVCGENESTGVLGCKYMGNPTTNYYCTNFDFFGEGGGEGLYDPYAAPSPSDGCTEVQLVAQAV